VSVAWASPFCSSLLKGNRRRQQSAFPRGPSVLSIIAVSTGVAPNAIPSMQRSVADLCRRTGPKEALEHLLFRLEPPASANGAFPGSIRAVEDRH
jgi:hypothetical protein